MKFQQNFTFWAGFDGSVDVIDGVAFKPVCERCFSSLQFLLKKSH